MALGERKCYQEIGKLAGVTLFEGKVHSRVAFTQFHFTRNPFGKWPNSGIIYEVFRGEIRVASVAKNTWNAEIDILTGPPFILKYNAWKISYKYENGDVFIRSRFALKKRLLEYNDLIYEFNIRVRDRILKGRSNVECRVLLEGSVVLSIDAEKTGPWWVLNLDKMKMEGTIETGIEDPLTLSALILGFQDFMDQIETSSA